MDPLWEGLREAEQAWLALLSLPYYYLAIALTWWHASREVALQRRLFHVRLYGALSLTLMRTGAGALAGIALSAASFAVGARLSPETLLCVWAAMLVLALFRLRYMPRVCGRCARLAAGRMGCRAAGRREPS